MRIISLLFIIGLVAVSSVGCQRKPEAKKAFQKQLFGNTSDGKQVDLFTLTNKNGVEVAITNYGGYIVSLKVPDRAGKLADVVLGYDNLDGYLNDKFFFGGTIGRYANRIARGKFKLNGATYTLALNNGENTLHGGAVRPFHKVIWDAKDISTANAPALQLNYTSKDGEEGYPGNLFAQVTFTLTDNNELRIDYAATTDKDTVVNLTNHSYFNLGGQGNGDILQHQLMLKADQFTPVDPTLIPTGELQKVNGTPFDFTAATAIGARINQDNPQLTLGKGYDHNWVLNPSGSSVALAAQLYDPASGRVLEISSTEPGIQFYSGNFLDGSMRGKSGRAYAYRSGLCLEPQHFPDSPNRPAFPTTLLKPGEHYKSTSVYKFSVK